MIHCYYVVGTIRSVQMVIRALILVVTRDVLEVDGQIYDDDDTCGKQKSSSGVV